MSGFFRRFFAPRWQLFAPRWQHRDPAIRQQAVAHLDAQQSQDRERLEQLASDADAGVRQAALARLDDPAPLLGMLAKSDSPELRARLLALLAGQVDAPSLNARLSLVERVSDQPLLAELALHADNQELRLAALARLDDEAALIHQACENGIAAVRHAAAARVISEEGLSQLARRARRDKQVARLARNRLNRRREDAAQARAQHIKRQRILDALEQHARHIWEPLYAGRYRHLQREWEQLTDLPTQEQEHRYQEASLHCRKVITDHEAQQQAIEHAERQRDDSDEARRSLIKTLEQALASLRQEERITDQDIASLNAHRRLLANRWQTLSDRHAPEVALSDHYAQALAEYDRINHAWERLEHQAASLEEALHDQDARRLQKALQALAWPDDLPPSPLLMRVRRFLDDQHPAYVDSDRFAQDLAELERLLNHGAFKQASRLHQSLRQRSEALSPEQRRAHQSTLKRLGAQLAELRDWRGFVAGPKRDQLYQAIVELADDTTLSNAELDRRHRQLLREWKALGDAAANRDLSSRFRAASERIHERLAAWRQTRDEERQHNLNARETLCEQLEALLNNPDPRADPDALRQIRDRAREQWRRFSPVPRDQAENIGQRFGRIRHALQTLIDQRAQAVAAAKRELVEQARALQSSSDSAIQRAEQAKGLQRRWRELGRAPKGEEQALWREFRGLCDSIFAARENERDNRVQRAQARLDDMQALIERIDAWQPATSSDTDSLNQAIAEAESLEPLPSGRRSEGMRRRWAGIVRARRERLSQLALSEEVQRWLHLQPLIEAHQQADARMLEGQPAVDVEAIEGLDDALHGAHKQRNRVRHTPPDAARVEEALIRLRVHLALLAGGRISRDDEPLRLAIQVDRLNESRGQARSQVDELHGVLCGILATGPVPPSLWAREADKLNMLLTQLSQQPSP